MLLVLPGLPFINPMLIVASFLLALLPDAVVRWTTADGRSGKTEKLGSSIGFGHTGSRSLKYVPHPSA